MGILSLLFGLVFAPLLPGIINRTKAFVAGRRGPPLLQRYYDIAKLLRKGAVYSSTTTWIFKAGPMAGLAAVTTAGALVPLGQFPALFSFPGDCLVFVYLIGLGRFFTMLAALDTGSAFEGMGASREAFFSALTEVVFLVCLVLPAALAGSGSLSDMLNPGIIVGYPLAWTIFLFLSAALFVVVLAENARVPFDDPATHLELTMIHEVMALDHSGPDLAFIEYGAALKLWLLGLLPVQLLVFHQGAWGVAAVSAGMLVLAVLIGVVESVMARLQMSRVPRLISGALAAAGLGVVFLFR